MRHGSNDARVMGMRPAGTVLALLLAIGLTACGEDPKPEKTPPDDAAVADGADVAGIDDTTDETDAPDVVTIKDVADSVIPKSDAVDAVSTVCLTDNQCVGKVGGLKTCQLESCDKATGSCIAIDKPGTCCSDAVCDDKVPCTTDKCDLGTATCQHAPIPGVSCGGQQLLTVGFEQKSLEGFKQNPEAGSGNVKWQLESRHTHSGKSALYFGNECYSYDTSVAGVNDCKTGVGGQPITNSLKFPEFQIPKGQLAILDFWIWIDTQPSFLTTLPPGNCAIACKTGFVCSDLGAGKGGSQCLEPLKAGNCKAACEPGSTCVDLTSQGAGSTCLPEKDVVKLKINGIVAWDSTKIGKSTGGKWVHVPITLADAGEAPVVSLDFAADAQKNNYEGIYLDDVRVQTLETKVGSLCDSKTPCGDDKLGCTNNDCVLFGNQVDSGLCYYDKIAACCEGVIDCEDANNCTLDACKTDVGATKGTCTNIPDSANDQCCQPANLFGDDFTTGINGWKQQDGNSTNNVNWKGNPSCKSGACLYFGNTTFNSYDDGLIAPKETICSKPIALQQGTIYDVLTFNLRMDTEWNSQPKDKYKNPPLEGTPKVDLLTVQIKPEGSAQTVWSSDEIQGTTAGLYQPITVSLDAFQGKSVKICFTFDAGDNSGNKFPGIFVDDVKVDVACKKTVCDMIECAKLCTSACETPTCSDGTCGCVKLDKACCETDAACDDKDTCTEDKCTVGKCVNNVSSPSCCSNKTPIAEAFEFEGKLPTGWTIKSKTGNAQGGVGKPYDTTIKWNISPLKSTGTNSTYSLYFGNNGTYNAGTSVPAGDALSPNVVIPANGTSLITFDLFLATEWNPPAEFKAPGAFVVDRMRVGLFDPTEKDATKAYAWIWSSYDIGGTTNSKWQSVVFKVPDAWKGKTVRLDFEFDAGTDAKNTAEGAYVDNLQLQTLCTKPPCVADVDCPGTDPCKKYFCAKEATDGTFVCKTDFKPGAGCCSSGAALPVETFESGLSSNWKVASEGCGDVKWQVVDHKKLNGSKEIYFGNPAKSNYDCPGLPVSGSVCTSPFQLSNDIKKGANLTFKGWFGIEAKFESFKVLVTYQSAAGPTQDVVMDKDPAANLQGLLAPASGKCGGEYCAVVSRTVDLSKYKGKGNVVVCLQFESGDASGNATYEGIYLDDLQMNEPCQ